MAITLGSVSSGSSTYIATHNSNYAIIQSAINTLQSAMSSLGGVTSIDAMLRAIFGTSTSRIDETGVVAAINGGAVDVTTGYVWDPGLGLVVWVGAGSTASANLAAYGDGTYYLRIDSLGNLTISASSSGYDLYSVVKSSGTLGSLSAFLGVSSFTNSNPLGASHGGTGRTTLTSGYALTGNGTGTVNMIAGSSSSNWFRWTGSAWAASTSTLPNTTTINRLLYSYSSNNIGDFATANNGTLVTSSSGVPSILAGPGVAGRLLNSNAAAAPSWLATANNGVLVTDGSGVASIGSSLPSAVQGNITSLGTIASGTWTGTAIGAVYGGTGQTGVTTGDLLYGSATNTWSRLSGVATGNALISGGVGTAVSWGKITNSHIDTAAAIAVAKVAGTDYRIPHGDNAGALTTTSGFTWTGAALSVPGTVSVSGTLTSTKAGFIFEAQSGDTNAHYFRVANTGGSFYLGLESSSAGGFFTGSSAYAGVFYCTTDIDFMRGGALRLAIESAGVRLVGTGLVTGNFGCNNVGPASQAALVADASDLATAITLVNAIKASYIAHGFMAAA